MGASASAVALVDAMGGATSSLPTSGVEGDAPVQPPRAIAIQNGDILMRAFYHGGSVAERFAGILRVCDASLVAHLHGCLGLTLGWLVGCGGIVVFDGEGGGGGGSGGSSTSIVASTSPSSSTSTGTGPCTLLAVPWDQECSAYIATACCDEAARCENDPECGSLWTCIYIECGQDNPMCVESCFKQFDAEVAEPLFACAVEDPSCRAVECETSLTSRSLACDEALAAECCGQLQQCEVAANGCGPFFQCTIDCGFDPMCRQSCIDQFPGGVMGSQALFGCFDQQGACQFDL